MQSGPWLFKVWLRQLRHDSQLKPLEGSQGRLLIHETEANDSWWVGLNPCPAGTTFADDMDDTRQEDDHRYGRHMAQDRRQHGIRKHHDLFPAGS